MFVLIPLAVAACGNQSADVRTGATPTPITSPTPSPEPCEPTRTGGQPTQAFLKDVRVGTHEGYDRVTFEFEAATGVPRFQLDPAAPPFTKDPSDEPMKVDGSKFARIIFHGGSGVDIGTAGFRETYTGPNEFKPAHPVLLEAEEQGDYEATLSWLFGFSRDSCWKVSEMTDPLRAVIDFAH